jgi:hypothetical protein
MKSESDPPQRHAVATADAKWAALVDDRLVPMPRRRLKARDILSQSGARPGLILVRDYNSPHDIGFDADAEVDLAEGNVFRTSSNCATGADTGPAAPAKLAFLMDDRWEVSIQSRQTGDTLRGLFGTAADVDILRDYESPRDEPIDDDERVHFSDGPVFVTRKHEAKDTIIVNGRRKTVSKRRLSFTEIVALAYDPVRTEPFILYTVSYSRGPRANPEGDLLMGQTVKLKQGMVFCVTETDKS